LGKPLLDIIFASEKRKNVLLLLQDGPKKMEFLLKSLHTNRQALLPQIRILDNHYLITHSHDVYVLTTIGKLIVDEMIPFLDTVESLESDIDYWGNRNLDFIPPHLFKRISELEECTIVNPSITKIYELNDKITDSCYNSDSVSMIAASFHPDYPAIFSEMANKNVKVRYIYDRVDEMYQDYLKGNFNLEFEKKYEGKNMETIIVSKSRVSTSILIVRLLFIIVSIAYFADYSGVLFITYNLYATCNILCRN